LQLAEQPGECDACDDYVVIMAFALAGTMHALSSGVAAASSPMPGVVYFAEDDLIRAFWKKHP